MMTTHSMHHPKVDIHRLYLPRSSGGRGLTQLELSYKTSTIGLFRYLNLSDDWMLELALKHEKEKGYHSVVKEAKKFAREIDLDLETEFDGEMKNTENAQKLKRIAEEKGKKAIDTAWQSKSLHGQYTLRSQKADVDLHDTHQWLRSAGLKAELKGLLLLHKIRASSRGFFRLIFFIIGLTVDVDSAIQALRLLTTSSQGALFLPQISIKTDAIVLDNIYTGKYVTIMILKHPTNGMSKNRYLL